MAGVCLERRLEMAEYAVSRLKEAGFTLAYASLRSEACYYRLGDCPRLLRVATHRYGGGSDGECRGPVTACLTFGVNTNLSSFEAIDSMIFFAVGRYIMCRPEGTERWRKHQGRRFSDKRSIQAKG